MESPRNRPQNLWRREWDSNPRGGSPPTRSPGERLRPTQPPLRNMESPRNRPQNLWRREWDSNPRGGSPPTRFRGERFRPAQPSLRKLYEKYQRLFEKNFSSNAPASSAMTPPVTLTQWLSLMSRGKSNIVPAAPVLGSAAP